MDTALDNPFAVLFLALVAQWLAAFAGDRIGRERRRTADEEDRQDFEVLRNAALTLLALIVGFSFSMAVSRYDQRKNYEEAEANAIGTEYVRADLLPGEEAAALRKLLAKYVAQRILFYAAHDERQLGQINADTAELQSQLWFSVSHAASLQPTPITALAVGGMNDVLNSQGYTQAAWWNRIPGGAWALMGVVAIACNLLIGYGERRSRPLVLLILPAIMSISFFLIADIDSPRGGVIQVLPQNLMAAAQSMGQP